MSGKLSLNVKLKDLDIESIEDMDRYLKTNDRSIKNGFGDDLFLISITENRLDLVKHLLEKHEWDIQSENSSGENAYLIAVQYGYLEIMKFLEGKDFPIYKSDKSDFTAYITAILANRPNVLEYLDNTHDWDLTKNPEDKFIYIYAARVGNMEIIKHIENKLNKNKDKKSIKKIIYARNSSNEGALLAAAIRGHNNVIKYLLDDKKWNKKSTDKFGADAYLYAIQGGNLETVKLLETNYNWDVSIMDDDGDDAYLVAAYHGHLHIMKHLEDKHNWDVNIINKNNFDAYSYAKMEGYGHIIKHLGRLTHHKELAPYDYEVNSEFVEEIKKSEENIIGTDCMVCYSKFEKSDTYCKCLNSHFIHSDCYIDYLSLNDEDEYLCVFCKCKMYKSTFSFTHKN